MITDFIHRRYPGSTKQREALRDALTAACLKFVESGLADRKFAIELCSGSDQKFWSCISEALVAERLTGNVFPERPAIGQGPDLLVLDGERKVWVEVVCPEPAGVSAEWLDPIHGNAVDFPHVELLLRWTGAIKAKAVGLMGSSDGSTKGYRERGVVGTNDVYVIAVNGCRLRSGPFPALFGISGFPFAAEAVFPIGPYQVQLDRESFEVVGGSHVHRFHIEKKNGAKVPADTFLDPHFRPISAIWALDVNGNSSFGGSEVSAIVHNPFATAPLTVGFLPSQYEYIGEIHNEEIRLKRYSGSIANGA